MKIVGPGLLFVASICLNACLPVYSVLFSGSSGGGTPFFLLPESAAVGTTATTPDPEITSAQDFNYSSSVNDTTTKDPTPGIMSMRALALSPDASTLYTCFVLGSSGNKFLRAYSATTGTTTHAVAYPDSPRFCKAAAVHSSGRVYYALADSDQIGVYNSDLSNQVLYNVDTAAGLTDTGNKDFDPEGVAVYNNFLYVGSDKLGRVYRFNLDPANGDILSHDNTWGAGFVQLMDGATNIADADNLVQLKVNAKDGSVWVAVENKDQVYRIAADGSSFSTPLTLAAGNTPHDIDFFFNYVLVAYGANDGSQAGPHGIGVFNLTTFASVTTLADTGSQLRNAQGLAVDESNRIIYVVDGFYGAPDDFAQAASYNENQADIIMKLTFNK